MSDDETARGMDLAEAERRARAFKGSDTWLAHLLTEYDRRGAALAERDAENERLRANRGCPSCGSIGSMWRAVTLAWGPPISTLRELYPGLTRALDDLSSRLPQLRDTDWSRR